MLTGTGAGAGCGVGRTAGAAGFGTDADAGVLTGFGAAVFAGGDVGFRRGDCWAAIAAPDTVAAAATERRTRRLDCGGVPLLLCSLMTGGSFEKTSVDKSQVMTETAVLIPQKCLRAPLGINLCTRSVFSIRMPWNGSDQVRCGKLFYGNSRAWEDFFCSGVHRVTSGAMIVHGRARCVYGV